MQCTSEGLTSYRMTFSSAAMSACSLLHIWLSPSKISCSRSMARTLHMIDLRRFFVDKETKPRYSHIVSWEPILRQGVLLYDFIQSKRFVSKRFVSGYFADAKRCVDPPLRLPGSHRRGGVCGGRPSVPPDPPRVRHRYTVYQRVRRDRSADRRDRLRGPGPRRTAIGQSAAPGGS